MIFLYFLQGLLILPWKGTPAPRDWTDDWKSEFHCAPHQVTSNEGDIVSYDATVGASEANSNLIEFKKIFLPLS